MSTREPADLLARVTPFDRLDEQARQSLASVAGMARFEGGTTVVGRGAGATHLYVVVDGRVHEVEDDEVLSVYSAGDSFDARALMEGHSPRRFTAATDTTCIQIPRDAFLEAAGGNPAFGGFFLENLSRRLEYLIQQESNRSLSGFMVARIEEGYIHPPLYLDAGTSIHDAARAMKEAGATSALVRRDGAVGILTGKDLREAAIIERRPLDGAIGEHASYDLIALEASDFLFNALLAMTRHGVRRVVVRRDGEIAGVLEQVDLLSRFSSHSQAVVLRIVRARTVDDLGQASREIVNVVRALDAKGVKTRYTCQLVSELNKKVFRRLYELVAPPELAAESCLLVMGSEGREEQILKTDQDNALILRDGIEAPALQAMTRRLTECLLEFGYPPCPGEIMVSNPYWAKPQEAYRKELRRWIFQPDEESSMRFAMFFDALAVAGDGSLLEGLREDLYTLLQDHQAFYMHFAKATLSFETPLGFFANFVVGKKGHRDELDIKKGGIFPIVHGARSLALQRRLRQTNTIERIKALSEQGIVDRALAVELIEAFAFMSSLRLKAGLRKIDQALPQDNYIKPKELNTLERDLLRDSFKIVNRFKKLITAHFRLEMVG